MKLGSFFGLTAPILMILEDSEEGALDLSGGNRLLDTAVDVISHQDVLNELAAVKYNLEHLPVKFKSSYQHFEVPARLIQSSLVQGVLIPENTSEDSEELLRCVIREIYYTLGEKLAELDDEKLIPTWACDDTTTLLEYVSSWVRSNEVKLSRIIEAANKLKRSLLKETSSTFKVKQVRAKILSKFDLSYQLDFSSLNLTASEQKILSRLYDLQWTIPGLMKKLSSTLKSEEKIFGLTFYDILNSNPRRLLFLVQQAFEEENPNFFAKVLEECKESFNLFEQKFNNLVVSYSEEYSSTLLTEDKLQMLMEDASKLEKEIFQKLLADINRANIVEEDVKTLIYLYNFSSTITREALNGYFDVDLSVEEWQGVTEHLGAVGIGGLSLFSLDLFRENVSVVSFSDTVRVRRDEAVIAEYQQYINDIHCLLDTLRPIGGEL